MKSKNNDSKKDFIEKLMSMTREDIEHLISFNGKPAKLITPAYILRK